MNTNIDLKSAVVGLVLGIIATIAIAAASPPSQIGRYQIAGTGNDGLIVDTATGQVWSAHFFASEGKTDRDFFLPKNSEKR